MKRSAARYRVCVTVRFGEGDAAVAGEAENVGRQGLFMALSGCSLRPGDEVVIELAVPGAEPVSGPARVAHVLFDDEAAALGRRAGAGFALADPSGALGQCLASYLERLSRRGDALVGVADDCCGRLLAAAGYQVVPIEEAADCPDGAFALVVSSAAEPDFQGRVEGAELLTMDEADELIRVLGELDARLG